MDTTRCPKCNRRCHWLTDVHFEHERSCGYCFVSWDPDNEEYYMRLAHDFLNKMEWVNTSGKK